jgi:hypothetical protein
MMYQSDNWRDAQLLQGSETLIRPRPVCGIHTISVTAIGTARGTAFPHYLLINCSDSWDHVPIRSWPLFKARRVLRTLLTTDKPLLNS